MSYAFFFKGILKQVKDYIKECSKCQEKLDRSRSLSDPSEILEELGLDTISHEDSNETDDELSNSASLPAAAPKPMKKKPISKHELVFVSSILYTVAHISYCYEKEKNKILIFLLLLEN